MKTRYQSLLLALGALALAGTASAQVPKGTWTGNDTSDQYFNTGMGTNALFSVTPNSAECGNAGKGSCNTASGYEALYSNTTGSNNTAIGTYALQASQIGNYNTATGAYALTRNQASNNTATGFDALENNDNGRSNTATGYEALFVNSSGDFNTASGFDALEYNSTGQQNTATGVYALRENRGGSFNTATGVNALYTLKGGQYNIADGYQAGAALTTGSYNIDIGNLGEGADSGIIRIGTSGQQTQAFIAGITNNSSVSGPYVVIDSSTGQLGVSTTPPSAGVKTAYVPTLQKEVRQQAAEIRDLKQEVEELKLFNQATQIALQKLQAKDELLAQR